jgi:predicted nucleotidyltransferase
VRQWAAEIAQHDAHIRRVGYTGSYARGDWGVGSDLDVLIVVDESQQPFMKRALAWDTSALPVPTDVMVYTQLEWEALARQNSRFYRDAAGQAVWVYERLQDSPASP